MKQRFVQTKKIGEEGEESYHWSEVQSILLEFDYP